MTDNVTTIIHHKAPEFVPYGKTPRLFRDCTVTEKIDGTNAAVVIRNMDADFEHFPAGSVVYLNRGTTYLYAQSRNRVIYPGQDNAGFGAWAHANAEALADTLGNGHHYGEWFGEGIQANPHRIMGTRFALFNTHRWGGTDFGAAGLPDVETVPLIWQGTFNTNAVKACLWELAHHGTRVKGAGPGSRAEGVVVYHSATRDVFKALIESDNLSKSQALALAA